MLSRLGLRPVASRALEIRQALLHQSSLSANSATSTYVPLSLKVPHPGLPKYIPDDVGDLKYFRTQVTTLENGIRVASENSPGQICTVGVVVDAGSRYETLENSGTSHFMERMAFRSTKNRTKDELSVQLETLGGTAQCASSRDSIIYSATLGRHNVPKVMEILGDILINPRFDAEELNQERQSIQWEHADTFSKPANQLQDLLHGAAYEDATLGLPLSCPLNRVHLIEPAMLLDYHQTYYSGSRLVVAGSGVSHEELCALAREHFGSIPKNAAKPAVRTKAVYHGGDWRHSDVETEDGMLHLALGYEAAPFVHEDLYIFAILQSLLGGGGSFSSGGPGKGMHSRLYTEVLNLFHWMDHCKAFYHCYADSAIFGINCVVPPARGDQAINVMITQLMSIAERISDVQLSRAKNQLKSSVLMNLESNLVTFEDIGRQVLEMGQRTDPTEMCDKVDRVTVNQIKEAALKMLSTSKPSFAAFGNVDSLRDYDSIVEAANKYRDKAFPK